LNLKATKKALKKWKNAFYKCFRDINFSTVEGGTDTKSVGWVGWQPRVENCARKTGNNTAKYERENERVQN
jgi:hypothetical protein